MNRIVALQDSNDTWVYKDDRLKDLVTNFFTMLYSSDGGIDNGFQTISTYPPIRPIDIQHLSNLVTFEETKSALSSVWVISRHQGLMGTIRLSSKHSGNMWVPHYMNL